MAVEGQAAQAGGAGGPQRIFFVLDRVTGEHLLTAPLVDPEFLNWAMGLNAKGQPISNPKKEPKLDGVLVGRDRQPTGLPPSFDPQTGLFYVGTNERMGMTYLVDTSERPEGYGLQRRRGRQCSRRARPGFVPSITRRAR